MKLELKVLPLIVVVVIGLLMLLTSWVLPTVSAQPLIRYSAAMLIVITGIGVVLSGALTFKKSATTVNPLSPESTSTLVTTGLYKFSRNPMYIGFALTLFGLTLALGSYFSVLWLVIYMLYINQFQIKPEEEALEAKFTTDYQRYKQSVRRWL